MKFEDYSTIPLAFSGPLSRYTNEFTNPSFEKADGTVEIYRNLFTNPSFEAAGSTVEVWRNRYTYANAETGATTGWQAQNSTTLSASTDRAHSGTYSYKVVCPGAVAFEGVAPAPTNYVATGVAGAETHAIYIWAPVGAQMTMLLQERLAADNSAVATLATTNFVGTGEWQLVVASGTKVTAANKTRIYISTRTTAQAITFYVDDVSATATPVHVWNPDDPDLTLSFVGAANASESILSAPRALDASLFATSQANFVQSDDWSAEGAFSGRVIPNGTNDSHWRLGQTGMPLVAGRTYTVVAAARLSAPLVGTLSSESRRIVFWAREGSTWVQRGQSLAAPNTAGAHEVRLTFTVPATMTDYQLRFCNGASIGNGDVWWDLVTLVEETVTPGAVLRTNLVKNPRAGVDLTGVGGVTGTGGTAARTRIATGGPSGIDSFIRQEWSVGSSSVGAIFLGTDASARADVLPSTEYRPSAWVRSSVPMSVYVDCIVYDAAGTNLLDTTQTNVALAANTWTRVPGVAFTTPANAATAQLRVVTTTNPVTGLQLDVTGGLLETGSALGPYFDGNTFPVSDSPRYRWTGTPNASTSEEFAATVTHYSGPAFSGNTPGYGDFDFSWTGTANASASVQTATGIDGISDTGVYRSGIWSYEGAYSAFVPEGDSIELALTGTQTVVVVARNAGQTLTVDGSTVTSTNNNNILRGTGGTDAILGPGWWDLLTIVNVSEVSEVEVRKNLVSRPKPQAVGTSPQADRWAATTDAGGTGLSLVSDAPAVAGIPNLAGLTTAVKCVMQATASGTNRFSQAAPGGYVSASDKGASELTVPVVAGQSYTLNAVMACNKNLASGWNAGTGIRIDMYWMDSSGTVISVLGGTVVKPAANTPTKITGTYTAPVGATQLRVMSVGRINSTDDPTGFIFWHYAMWVEAAAATTDYFDGSTPTKILTDITAHTYDWDGAANASASIESLLTFNPYEKEPFSGDTLSTTTVKYSWTGASDDSTSKRLSLEG